MNLESNFSFEKKMHFAARWVSSLFCFKDKIDWFEIKLPQADRAIDKCCSWDSLAKIERRSKVESEA